MAYSHSKWSRRFYSLRPVQYKTNVKATKFEVQWHESSSFIGYLFQNSNWYGLLQETFSFASNRWSNLSIVKRIECRLLIEFFFLRLNIRRWDVYFIHIFLHYISLNSSFERFQIPHFVMFLYSELFIFTSSNRRSLIMRPCLWRLCFLIMSL